MKWFSKPKALSLEDWDLWHTVTKRNYPIQYFMRISIPNWFHRYVRGSQFAPLTRLCDWIYFHLPKNRQHILSLQQNFGLFDDYKYGNLTIHEGILYANFNLICRYKDSIQRQLSIPELDVEHYQLLIRLTNIINYWQIRRPFLFKERNNAPTYDDSIDTEAFIRENDEFFLNEIVSLYPQLKQLGI